MRKRAAGESSPRGKEQWGESSPRGKEQWDESSPRGKEQRVRVHHEEKSSG